MTGLFKELKRRNVVRVGVAYIVVGWVVVQIAQVLFEAFGTPDWVIKTVIVLIAIGFPFALIFAWAFELTPQGLKKTREVDLSTSITHNTGRKLDFVIIAALAIALGYFIWERQTHDHAAELADEPVAEALQPPPDEQAPEVVVTDDVRRSIAVLPFVNMSSDQEQEWFADGLTEEILNSLAKMPDLLVTARTSSFTFKGSNQPVTDIATTLGVDHVLEGSVRRGGETLRITAQLIRAADGFHLWSETFDRTMDDIISIQEEIAVQIADALEVAMDPEALAEMLDSGTASVPAYEAYLTAWGAVREAQSSGDPYIVLQGREGFERAVEIDPEYANAWFSLYFFWTIQGQSNQLMSGVTELSADEIRANKDSALENAIRYEQDDLLRKKYLGFQAWESFGYRRALRHFQELYEERPSDENAFTALLNLMRDLGMHREATELIRSRYAEFEFDRRFASQALQGLRTPEDTEFMRTIAQHALDKFGDDANIAYQAHRQLLWAGDIDGAANVIPLVKASELPEENIHLVDLRQACAEQRLHDASAIHNEIVEKHADQVAIVWLSYSILGDTDGAIATLKPLDEADDTYQLSNFLSYTQFDPNAFPSLVAALSGTGIAEREIIDPPYRCNR
jgi:TolB-like protein